MPYQSPISPGLSWYEATVGDRPAYPALDGGRSCDVVIVGGGYAGLSAAVELARRGTEVVLIEQHRLGDGASGRNGGQLGSGQRIPLDEMERQLGWTRAKALFDLGEEAKRHLLNFMAENAIDADYRRGQLSVSHKRRFVDEYRAYVDYMNEKADYPLSFMDAEETARRLGSRAYFGGSADMGTGHLHPLKLLVGTARVAAAAGARLHEQTKATAIRSAGGRVTVETSRGTITARHALIVTNAHGGDLEAQGAAHVMPIGSFIGATVPLEETSKVLPGGEAVDDSRFVVRYFRRSIDGRLLFGGREIYSSSNSADIRRDIRRQIAQVYPDLADIKITHAWGGYVGITVPRLPYVREVMPNVISVGGFSGHGVMLANFTGRLYAEALAGRREKLKLLEDLKIPPFPGGRRFRPLLMWLALNWFALRDRI